VASKTTIAKAVALIARNWPDKDLDLAKTCDLYQTILGDLPDAAVMAAVTKRIGSDNPFLPRVGEIRKLALNVLFEDEGQPTPEQAWGILLRWIRRYANAYAVPYWQDGKPVEPPKLPEMIWQAARDVGGVSGIAESEFLAADRARFIDAYTARANRRRERLEELPAVTAARKQLWSEARAIARERVPALGDGRRDDHEAMLADEREAAFETE
jgi:hypothetical protein